MQEDTVIIMQEEAVIIVSRSWRTENFVVTITTNVAASKEF